MLPGGVALVPAKAILGILAIQCFELTVSLNLG
jgi:hypothetical protein